MLVVARNEVLVRIVLAMVLVHAVMLLSVHNREVVYVVNRVLVMVPSVVGINDVPMMAVTVSIVMGRHSLVNRWNVMIIYDGFLLLRSSWRSRTCTLLLHIDSDNGGGDSHFRLLLRLLRLLLCLIWLLSLSFLRLVLFFLLRRVPPGFAPVILVFPPALVARRFLVPAPTVMAGPLDLELVRILDVVVRLLTLIVVREVVRHWLAILMMVPVDAVGPGMVLVPRQILLLVEVLPGAVPLAQVLLDVFVVVQPVHSALLILSSPPLPCLLPALESLTLVLPELEFFIGEQVVTAQVVFFLDDRLRRVMLMPSMMMD